MFITIGILFFFVYIFFAKTITGSNILKKEVYRQYKINHNNAMKYSNMEKMIEEWCVNGLPTNLTPYEFEVLYFFACEYDKNKIIQSREYANYFEAMIAKGPNTFSKMCCLFYNSVTSRIKN